MAILEFLCILCIFMYMYLYMLYVSTHTETRVYKYKNSVKLLELYLCERENKKSGRKFMYLP